MPTQKEIRDWFDHLYEDYGLESMRSEKAYPVFLDYLNVKSGKRLLDVGCGTGFLLKEASGRGLEAYGVDLSREAVRLARQVVPEATIKVGHAEALDFDDDYFDYLTCTAALEHFVDMEQGLREMRRVAREDARFCIMVPNSDSLVWRVAVALNAIDEESNENAQSLKAWTRLLTGSGFEIVTVIRDRWWTRKALTSLSLDRVGFVKRWMDRPSVSPIPLRYANQLVFILENGGG
ncbi:MAG: class I SAM-dependent methyltransferase [Fidelibacterota bacterium]